MICLQCNLNSDKRVKNLNLRQKIWSGARNTDWHYTQTFRDIWWYDSFRAILYIAMLNIDPCDMPVFLSLLFQQQDIFIYSDGVLWGRNTDWLDRGQKSYGKTENHSGNPSNIWSNYHWSGIHPCKQAHPQRLEGISVLFLGEGSLTCV